MKWSVEKRWVGEVMVVIDTCDQIGEGLSDSNDDGIGVEVETYFTHREGDAIINSLDREED